MTYGDRARVAENEFSKRILGVMETKKTNLCVSADVTTAGSLLKLAEQVGPHICLLKLHADIIDDFSSAMMLKLRELAQTHNFLLFEGIIYYQQCIDFCHPYINLFL